MKTPRAATGGRSSSPARRVSRLVLKGLRLALLALLLGLVGSVLLGVPDVATRRVLARMNRGAYAWEARRLILDPRLGIVARDVALFLKGRIGPPIAEAPEVRLGVDPLTWLRRPHRWTWRLEVRGGVIRPHALDAFREPSATPARAEANDWRILLEDCRVMDVEIARLETLMRADAGVLRLTALRAGVGQGPGRGLLESHLWIEPARGMRGHVVSTFDPRLADPLCGALEQGSALEFLSSFEFPDGSPPRVDADVAWNWGEPRGVIVEGHFQASRFRYRGADISFADLGLQLRHSATNATLTLQPLVLVIGTGTARGNVTLDWREHTVAFEVASTADPAALARIVNAPWQAWAPQVQWGGAPRTYARGRIGVQDPRLSAAQVRVEGLRAAWRGFSAEGCSFRFRAAGPTNEFTDVRGQILGGSFTGSARFHRPGITRGETHYEAHGEVLSADFERLLQELVGTTAERYGGRLSGSLDVSGTVGRSDAAVGQGYAGISRGRVFRVPLFGGLSATLAEAIPGLDFALTQTDARVPFEIRSGRVESRDARIEGRVLSLTAAGSCTFGGALDFRVLVRPLKEQPVIAPAVRVVTYPLSRLLEFRLEGTLEKPVWRPTNFTPERNHRPKPPADGAAQASGGSA